MLTAQGFSCTAVSLALKLKRPSVLAIRAKIASALTATLATVTVLTSTAVIGRTALRPTVLPATSSRCRDTFFPT